MKDQKYTKGPWYAVEYSGFHNLHDSDFYGATNLLDEDECAAAPHNVRLAAAAPDLLEALIELLNVDELDTSALFKAQQKATLAIDKAIGNELV